MTDEVRSRRQDLRVAEYCTFSTVMKAERRMRITWSALMKCMSAGRQRVQQATEKPWAVLHSGLHNWTLCHTIQGGYL